ncbi:hypothetical protein [Devosia sp.]|uniref:ImuA family protein n=1 Tax=Devosia sp. TaxID=1871048 RepID=UPI00326686B3
MQALEKQQALAALRDKIAGIVDLPPLHASAVQRSIHSSPSLLSLPGGLLHEIFTDERRNGGAALGFALGSARDLLTSSRPAVIYLQLAREAQEMGLPYGAGLAAFGFDPEALLLIRADTITELLWAAEEAIACRAVAAVIVDVAGQPKALDFTASRRLSLRAAKDGASFFLLRYGTWREASAAQFRWHLRPVLSAETPFDARAPGEPRWLARLEKGAINTSQHEEWLLGWTDHGFERIGDPDNSANRTADRTALPRFVPAGLADGLSKTA